jgi:hypothetical protein
MLIVAVFNIKSSYDKKASHLFNDNGLCYCSVIFMASAKIKSISFHPRLAAIFEFIFGLILLGWFVRIGTTSALLMWFFLPVFWWFTLARFVYYSKEIQRGLHLVSLFIFHVGTTSWLLFVDKWSITWDVVVFLKIVLSALSFWILPTTQNDLSFVGKPQRRFRLMLTLFGLSGMWSGVGALIVFNIFPLPLFIWILAGSFLTMIMSVMWWKEYGVTDRRSLLLWTGAVSILVFECAWVIELLPIHYLCTGFIITWLWYVVWLLARFKFSSEGIQWKRQLFFLLGTTIFLIAFLVFFVKWK